MYLLSISQLVKVLYTMARPIPFLVAIMSGFSISSPFAQLFGVLPGGDGH